MTGDESKRYEEAKTLNELYELIKFDYNLHIGEADLSHYADTARRAYVRIRNSALAENPSLDISDVPQSADLGTVMDCCASALFTWDYLQSLSPDAKRRYLESLPDTKPPGLSPDTLNWQQLRQFGAESAAIYKAKTLREIVPLWKRFLNNWEFIFVRYPSDPFAEKVSGQFTKSYLIKLAESEPDLPMDFHISDYPDTFSGMKDLMMGLERALEKADNASTKQNGKKTKSKGRGRPRIYNEKFLQRVIATFEQKYQGTRHKQQAWQETAEEHNLKSGKAAEIACRRYLKKQNKKQN
jgi:hypothetical protein